MERSLVCNNLEEIAQRRACNTPSKQSKALLRQLFLKNLSTIRNPLDGKQRRNHSFAVCYFDHAPGLSIPNI
jgi:hypothetical protein